MRFLELFVGTTFERQLRQAMFRIGPGEPVVLSISDEEFFEAFGSSGHRVSKHEGIWAILVEAWGTKVYVTCPKLGGQSTAS